ncbi:hypothetical protein [Winogradskyella alexanderae]|uniref:DUF1579 domain-containing protein n=1 Tax=Winogradskyella alexanderae TaxID=2877123 RepID=A0ABS7XUN0_9FLAO|nr:hypothetical protein [Winogradskyella alexanderae]MCA0133730.1 hypothetical protein [Winogradskyella alexanderae]
MTKKTSILMLLMAFTFSYGQNQNCACCTEKYSEFDFWIGSWEVISPNGTKAGENTLEKLERNCVLKENWTSATLGYTGTSNSFYNLKTKQWEQIWVDNQGASLHLKGTKVGNQMILESEKETNLDGISFFHRVTWTANEDGTVRQLWETFTEGKDVIVVFDGLYKRKECLG